MSLFADLNKKSNDLLNDDFNFDHKVEIKSSTQNNVTVTSSLTRDQKKGSFLGVLKTKFVPLNYVTVNTTLDTAGKVQATATIDKFVDGAKIVADNNLSAGTSKLSLEFLREFFTIAGSVELGAAPKATVSGVISRGNLSAGAEVADLDVANAKISAQYDAGAFIAGVKSQKQADDITLSYFHRAKEDIAVGGKYNIVRSKGTHSFELGFLYSIDKRTSFRSKVDSNGIVSVVYGQDLRPGLAAKISAQIDSQNTAKPVSKFGVALTADL